MAAAFAMSSNYRTGPWTIDDVLSLPEDGMRHEVVEGRLVVSPAPARPHQRAAKRLEWLLDDALPPRYAAMRELNLRIGADLLIPDVMVALTAVLTGPGRFVEARDVVLVVEILSPGNSTFERAWKPQRYADAGIPFYAEIDLVDGPRIGFHELRGRHYVEIAYAAFELSLDPADLVGPRR